MYVWYGTNEYNFEKLENPPTFEPTLCSECGKVIHMGTGGFSQLGEKYTCGKCSEKEMRKIFRRKTRSKLS
jgi:transposase